MGSFILKLFRIILTSLMQENQAFSNTVNHKSRETPITVPWEDGSENQPQESYTYDFKGILLSCLLNLWRFELILDTAKFVGIVKERFFDGDRGFIIELVLYTISSLKCYL